MGIIAWVVLGLAAGLIAPTPSPAWYRTRATASASALRKVADPGLTSRSQAVMIVLGPGRPPATGS
jgi:hypothetical protein